MFIMCKEYRDSEIKRSNQNNQIPMQLQIVEIGFPKITF